MSTQTQRRTLQIGHSPDPDDAFMWYPLANDPQRTGPDGKPLTPKIDTGPYDFVHILEDIQSLNERSATGELEITAISIHQYPHVADKYALTSCGSSMGDGYGPMLVCRNDLAVDGLDQMHLNRLPKAGTPQGWPSVPGRPPVPWEGIRVAVPGERTTAFLAFSLMLREMEIEGFDYVVLPFDEIIPAVSAGNIDAGLIIHEGQLTYGDAGLKCLIDLGQWWSETRGLPLPLGGNAIRRDLGVDEMGRICAILLDSIEWALEHREESIQFALNYARDMGMDLADRFVGMYVNEWTLDYGPKGREAVRRLLGESVEAGLIPDPGPIDFVEPVREGA